ncbi:MAG: hypothetical protein ACRC6F_02980 [Aeromonas sp.]
MTTLAIHCAVRNMQINNRKLAGHHGARLSQSPEGVAVMERPVALLWASFFRLIHPSTRQGV